MDEQRNNKHLMILIAVYFLFAITVHYSYDFSIGEHIKGVISNPKTSPPHPQTLLSIFKNHNYEGTWLSRSDFINKDLTKSKGKFLMLLNKISPYKYDLQLCLNNGQYISNGNIVLNLQIFLSEWQSVRNGTQVHLIFKPANNTHASAIDAHHKLMIFYQHKLIFQTLKDTTHSINGLRFIFEHDLKTNSLKTSLQIDSQQISVTMVVARQSNKLLIAIIFATVLFFIAFMQFPAIVRILKSILDGEEQLTNYSLVTVMVAMMWDASLCIASFVAVFSSVESLIFFLMPAFLLCILFMNLELRFATMVFEASSRQSNIRLFLSRVKLFSYGSLLVIYPLMYFFNLSPTFFFLLSLILVPQIYSNGINSHRPDISSAYYKNFLTTRFILILYLKCFPWNVFELEPDYIVGFGCISLLCLQLFWLRLQQIYGPRRILPKFLLPKCFNYDYKSAQLELESEQCSICISSLQIIPELGGKGFRVPYKIMKAPCGHQYHGSCLSEWMQIKKQCPLCRQKLPPYQ